MIETLALNYFCLTPLFLHVQAFIFVSNGTINPKQFEGNRLAGIINPGLCSQAGDAADNCFTLHCGSVLTTPCRSMASGRRRILENWIVGSTGVNRLTILSC